MVCKYFLCLWILPCWGLQTLYNYCPISTMHVGPLVALPIASTLQYIIAHYSPSQPMLIAYNHTFQSLGGYFIVLSFCSLPLNIGRYLFVVVNNVFFHSLPNGMGLVTFYPRRNAKIPSQGSTPFVQSQTIIPSTLFNKIEIQQTH